MIYVFGEGSPVAPPQRAESSLGNDPGQKRRAATERKPVLLRRWRAAEVADNAELFSGIPSHSLLLMQELSGAEGPFEPGRPAVNASVELLVVVSPQHHLSNMLVGRCAGMEAGRYWNKHA